VGGRETVSRAVRGARGGEMQLAGLAHERKSTAMDLEQLRIASERRPFRPFTVVSADGTRLAVPHPEFIALAPEGSTVVIWKGGAPIWVDVPLISAIDFSVASERRTRRVRR
jgi:hypothetical protein